MSISSTYEEVLQPIYLPLLWFLGLLNRCRKSKWQAFDGHDMLLFLDVDLITFALYFVRRAMLFCQAVVSAVACPYLPKAEG